MMKWDNWKSPIDIVSTQLRTEFDGEIMKAIQSFGIIVDKEELIKCMSYDRNQYENGYQQGVNDAIEKCAEINSRLIDMCRLSCPIKCEFGTEESCKDLWVKYFTSKLEEEK